MSFKLIFYCSFICFYVRYKLYVQMYRVLYNKHIIPE